MLEFFHYDDTGLEKQYALRMYRPDFDTDIWPSWVKRANDYRAIAPCRLDLEYGSLPRERLDFFSAQGGKDAPVVVYFHGGYWQRGSKDYYSFLAEPFVKNGISIAIVNYDLCPSVQIKEISEQARRAVAWVWRNASDLDVSRDKVFAMGHSAGGHITAMLMATDWPSHGSDLPRDLLRGGIPVSGLFDLVPLLPTSINAGLKMDEAEAKAESPMNNPPATNAPQLVVVGGRETPEFHRQSDIYANAFATTERSMERYDVPASDHFDELNELAQESSEFFRRTKEFIFATVDKAANGPVTEVVVREYLAAFNKRNLNAIEALFASDVEMLTPGGSDFWGTRFKGKDTVMDAIRARLAASPDLQWNDERSWVMGNKAVIEWRVTATQTDGSKLDCLGVDLLEYRGTKITKKDTYYKNVQKNVAR
ncbi:nuclear transport factor 2 family protein [Hyphomicrobium sp.]|uniref:nuclear transport factor 2 family protein n=1 Tax=Hyphomicrobium sp. TaxID=82 RepID=UPI001D261676|nr:nuclear transport factor 2 family protein [Hyphomicrobium sp.]MBY0558799.1 nuclear transport factor 2 family protein [Hyphomicrobium sp.]